MLFRSRRLDESLRDGKNRLLEMIAGGAPREATLNRLMLLIESQSEGVLCSVMLLGPDGTMHTAAAPSMPPSYLPTIDGMRIGAAAGSCGTAMHRKETVVVADIANDPLWASYKADAARHGLRACWSMPIMLFLTMMVAMIAIARHTWAAMRMPPAAALRT